MKQATILGIDLAKNVFHICVMNKQGRVLRRRRASRGQLFEIVLKESPNLVAMEACGGAHYWARRFEAAGLEVRQIPAQYVKPYVKTNKNDVADAEAICEAASRPEMRFVSTRTAEQQDVQNLHRIRERLVKDRTALANSIRGMLLEYGIVVPRGIGKIRNELHKIVEEHSEEYSSLWKATFLGLHEEFLALDRRIEHYEKQIRAVARSNESCQRLMKVPGVGEMTATAIVAAVGDPTDFKNGRDFAVWLGLTPRQHSTGGRCRLGGISKRGDKYLRKLLVQGARACAIAASKKRNHKDPLRRTLNYTERWLFQIEARRGGHKAIVALANKTARRIWVVLSGEEFKQPEELLPLAA